MAGAVLERELKGASAIHFEVATPADDAEIRRLLRNNPMRGAISVSLEREPNYFIDFPGETKTTIIARAQSRLVCVGSCAFRSRFVNGIPRRVGYLGALRLDAPFAGRFDILRRGYKFFHELQMEEPADFYFTSIAADNTSARRFLERGLPGMPTYELIGEFVTLLVPTVRSKANGANLPHAPNSAFNFTSCDPIFTEAIWDQRSFKQTVIRRYSPWLGVLRPLLNACGAGLPRVGETLSNAFVTDGALSMHLHEAHSRGIKFLTVGFASNDPRLQIARRHFRVREYRGCLYVVRWPGVGGAANELDGRTLAPEVALL
jgi:hypothetical protein